MTKPLHWLATPDLPPDHRGSVARPFSPLPDPDQAPFFSDALAINAQRWPERIAVDGTEGPTSYGELWRAVESLAARLCDEPSGGGPVGIQLAAGAAYVSAVFCCLAANRRCILLDASLPEARNEAVLAAGLRGGARASP